MGLGCFTGVGGAQMGSLGQGSQGITIHDNLAHQNAFMIGLNSRRDILAEWSGSEVKKPQTFIEELQQETDEWLGEF